MSTDKIIIEGIEFYGYHGDLPQERELGQRYRVDLTLIFDCRHAGKTDRLEDTIDYAAVVTRVRDIGRNEQYHLIEALAERIAGVLLEEFAMEELELRVTKPFPPIPAPVQNAGIEIRRRRS